MRQLAFASTFVSPQKYTPWPVIQNVRSNPERPLHPISIMFQIFSQPTKASFQLSLTVLILYRSCVIFRFGGQCPPHSRLISSRRYSRNSISPSNISLRDYHPLRFNFPVNLRNLLGEKKTLYTTSLLYYYKRFSLICSAFTRRY